MHKHNAVHRAIAAAAAVGVALATTLTVGAMPALAAGEVLNVIVVQEDGTAPFDSMDADATNGVVRTNDTVTYTVSVANQGGALSAPQVVFELPQGQELASLPTYCLTGSSVTPASLGALPAPLSATSWESFPVQTVTCVLADRSTSSTLDYDFTAKVRSEVPNGTTMDPFEATASATAASDGAPIEHTSNSVSVEVVAQPSYDISKNGTSSADDNSGYVAVNETTCTTQSFIDAGYVGCQTLRFPILISVQAGGKGNTPLSSDITFIDDISPDVFWGAGTTAKAGWDSSLAPAVLGCGAVTSLGTGGSFFPYGSSAAAGGATDNAVRNSGTFDCSPGSTGTISVTISGTDTTAVTYPSLNGTRNVAMPADKAYVVSGWFTVEYPMAALSAIGELAPDSEGSYRLPYENSYASLTATDLSGAELQAETNTDNNHRRGTTTIDLTGNFGKFFLGEPGNTSNSGGTGYASGNFAGPAGSAALRDGNGIVQPGGKILSGLTEGGDSPPGFGAVTQIICDAWDNTAISLTAAEWAGLDAGTVSPAAPFGTAGYEQKYPSNGAAVWLTDSSTAPLPTYTVEYNSGTPGVSSVNSCLNEGTGWVSDPALVAGNDPALAATGVYTAVSQVRIVTSIIKDDIADAFDYSTSFSIGFTVRDDVETGDVIGNWGSTKVVYSDSSTPVSAADALADAGDWKFQSSYGPEQHTGRAGDRVTVQAVTARLSKQVWDPAASTWVSNTVPVYSSDTEANYRLRPSLTAGVTTGATSAVIIEDCLPRYQSFVSSSLEGGDAILPALVSTDANPAGATLTCDAAETYIRWELGEQPINGAIPAVLYTVAISATAPNTVLTNEAKVTAEGDTSTDAARTSKANIQIETPTGIKIDKTVVNPLVEVNPADAANPRLLEWDVSFAVIDTTGISNIDVIDVLPAQGLGGTSFNGTLAFDQATIDASDGTPVLLYTSAAPASLNSDPEDSTNGAAGATVWCDASTGGVPVSGSGTAADCPANAAEVTGLRVLIAGSFPADGTLDMHVSMIALGNSGDDVYMNAAAANADGVLQGVGPVTRSLTVVASSIGDLVWNDLNANGIQDEDEPAVEGVPVLLSGTDQNGNVITASTATTVDGTYLFSNLPSGTYVVTFDPQWVEENGFFFTDRDQGTGDEVDSDADPQTGQSGEIVLGVADDRVDVDAGLVQVTGGLVIVKDLSGVGSDNAVGPFKFSVTCTYLGGVVFDDTVTLERVAQETTMESDRLAPIPVTSSCVITETDSAGADAVPESVTVVIVENNNENTVFAGFVNEYSAGTITVAKVLAGDGADREDVLALNFVIDVVCQVDVDLAEPLTVYSGSITVKGGESVTATHASGETVLLPLGSRCYGVESDDGGAVKSSVDYDSEDTAVFVSAGNPGELQSLVITATNYFDAVVMPVPVDTPDNTLAVTGVAVGGTLGIATLLIVLGLFLAKAKRRDGIAEGA
ncbi:SdrD B-like domain-containing protein [Microbacterium sp. NPDC076911]|uniref:SdrD B-like domain-containing protein n=1 Tax=Microbacterium sp. NPDC076911 TaxID=3154958 RepID=UPI003426E29A